MADFIFALRGMDITRKSVTGPGCTVYGKRGVDVQVKATDSDESRCEALHALIFEHSDKCPAKLQMAVAETGHVIAYFRGMAVGALVPADKYAGFLFVPKLQK
jgi:hypothetical protein